MDAAESSLDRPVPAPAGLRTRVMRVWPVVRTISYVAAVGLVIAMGVIAVRDLPSRDLDWWMIGGATVAATAWWLLLGRGWGVLASGRPTRADVSLWCRTQTLRYLPGGIWAPASRVATGPGRSLDRLSTVAAENLIALCAALAIGGIGLAAAGKPQWLPLVLLVAAPLPAARIASRWTHIGTERALSATWNYLLSFAAYVAAAVLVQGAVSGVHDPLAVAGAAAIAWGAGLVVIIAPGGVGVREVVYVELLRRSFGHGDLVAAAVTMRLVTIVAELAVLVAAGRPPGDPATPEPGRPSY